MLQRLGTLPNVLTITATKPNASFAFVQVSESAKRMATSDLSDSLYGLNFVTIKHMVNSIVGPYRYYPEAIKIPVFKNGDIPGLSNYL